MRTLVFVAPLFREGSNRFLQAFASLPGLRLGVISMEPASAIPPELKDRIHSHFQVRDVSDTSELIRGVRGLQTAMGSVERLLTHLEELQIPVSDARERLGLEGMHGDVARNFRDKDRMKAVLRAHGVPVAKSRLITSTQDAHRFATEVGYPIIVKPRAGLGARSTFRVKSLAELDALLAKNPATVGDPYQAEEFVEGWESTCETVTIDGQHVWRSGTHYLPGPLEVLENPWMQYCVLLPRDTTERHFREFDPLNAAALDALGMKTGLSHMEWFRRKDGSVLVNEVGGRPPGANIMPLMSHAYQTDMWRKWAELMAFGRFDPPNRALATGTAFFRGTSPTPGHGRVVAVHGLAEAQAEVGPYVVERKLPVVGQPRSKSYEGEGWAVVAHPDTRVVMQALKRLVELVRIEYA